MPTGYTSKILEGATFEEFVWECARGMGAFIMQRDDPSDAPPVLNEKVSSYHSDELGRAVDHLASLRARTAVEWRDEYKTFVAQSTAENERYVAKHRDERQKYEAMLKKVRDWDPPSSDHAGLKKFMVSQISESIEFDCDHDPYQIEIPDFETWRAKKLASAKSDIDYHTKELAEEQKRVDDRNRWKAQLLASVKLPK